ncbi:MAG: toluene tolerance protein [Gammaproteobacteria bacterium HGW-Gammaproteobacteria-8]|nr:MAG: toluene tolerance protein [Gammaproteobacteria bacterium HGW-Gammaproteobacteria-8]
MIRLESKIIAIAVLLVSTAAASAQGSGPVEIVRDTTATLFELVDGNRSVYESDSALLRRDIRDILLAHIDVVYSGRLVLGRSGRNLSRDQVVEFANALSDLLISRYADGLLEFRTRDQVEILPLAGDNTERMTRVRTRVGLDSGEQAPVDYVFRFADGQWKIFDVIVEGISYVATFRNQIGEEIRNTGFDATLERLKRGEIDIEIELND